MTWVHHCPNRENCPACELQTVRFSLVVFKGTTKQNTLPQGQSQQHDEGTHHQSELILHTSSHYWFLSRVAPIPVSNASLTIHRQLDMPYPT